MIYMLIGSIICLIGSFTLSVEGIVTFFVYGIPYLYFFFVLRSLMQQFSDERTRGINDGVMIS